MHLNYGLHLAYCTNVHRGETWAETLAALERHTLAVKAAVCPSGPYAIGLRLSDAARDHLAAVGYDPAYGARPLKRTIQREVENELARRIVAGEVRDGEVGDPLQQAGVHQRIRR